MRPQLLRASGVRSDWRSVLFTCMVSAASAAGFAGDGDAMASSASSEMDSTAQVSWRLAREPIVEGERARADI